MIRNERQVRVTKAQIARLKAALRLEEGAKDKIDRRLYEAMVAGITSQLEELQDEVLVYEKIKGTRVFRLSSVDGIGDVLIDARVAAGLTQRELGERLKLQSQQIQQYEQSRYRSASLRRIGQIVGVLGLAFDGCARFPLRPTADGVAADSGKALPGSTEERYQPKIARFNLNPKMIETCTGLNPKAFTLPEAATQAGGVA